MHKTLGYQICQSYCFFSMHGLFLLWLWSLFLAFICWLPNKAEIYIYPNVLKGEEKALPRRKKTFGKNVNFRFICTFTNLLFSCHVWTSGPLFILSFALFSCIIFRYCWKQVFSFWGLEELGLWNQLWCGFS